MTDNLNERIKTIVKKQNFTFEDLADIVRYLRSENGCPWDRAQTHDSIEINAIEETYELIDAVKKLSPEKMTEECGDVILQPLFHAVMGEEEGTFTVQDVINGECRKLIDRHSHIFGNDIATDADDALKQWEKNKYAIKKLESAGQRVSDIPNNLPALLRAEKVQKRAAKFNCDFTSDGQIYDKIQEEAEEIRQAKASGDKEKLKEEIGDLLFTAVNLARYYGVECETALSAATEKFISRFLRVEELILKDGKTFGELTPEEVDGYYNEVKKH